MKITLNEREREVLGFGLNIYETNGKAAIGTLTGLGVATTPVMQALDNCEIVKAQLGNSAPEQEIELTVALSQCARQALTVYAKKVSKVKENEEQLKIDTTGTADVLEAIETLGRRFDDQIDLDEARRGG